MANYILQEIIALSQLLSPPDVAHDEVIECIQSAMTLEENSGTTYTRWIPSRSPQKLGEVYADHGTLRTIWTQQSFWTNRYTTRIQ